MKRELNIFKENKITSELKANTLDGIVQEGIKRGLISIKNNRISYIAKKKTYNFSDPEEKVRARTYVELILRYKYPSDRNQLIISHF